MGNYSPTCKSAHAWLTTLTGEKDDCMSCSTMGGDIHFTSLSGDEAHLVFSGVSTPPVSDVTSDGYDLQFGTNVVGHFYFTKLLLPILLATAKTTTSGKVRVVSTSSMAHLMGDLDFATFRGSWCRGVRCRQWDVMLTS